MIVRPALACAVLLLAALACAADPADHDATAKHSFDDVEHWASVFDDPGRDAWQKPSVVIEKLGLRPGMRVADLGAGTGYFSRGLSEAVAPGGTVFAVDTEPKLVAYLRDRAERDKTDNVVPVLASPDDPRLPDKGVDVVLIVDTYHHLDDRLTYLRRLGHVLAPGGRVAVIDWEKRETPVGPELAHRLARETVVSEMEAAGYRFLGEPGTLPYQYFLVFVLSAKPA